MQKRDAILDMKWVPEREAYRIELWDFRFRLPDRTWYIPYIYISADKMPAEYRDQVQKFQVGDLVDKRYKSKQEFEAENNQFFSQSGDRPNEYYGKIIEVENE